jgi:hypothetical protein
MQLIAKGMNLSKYPSQSCKTLSTEALDRIYYRPASMSAGVVDAAARFVGVSITGPRALLLAFAAVGAATGAGSSASMVSSSGWVTDVAIVNL